MGELIVNGIKWAFIIAVSLALMTAIITFVDLLSAVVFSSIVGEVLGVISCFLPFNAFAVFSSIGTSCAAILSFMIAQKIYDLTSQHVNV